MRLYHLYFRIAKSIIQLYEIGRIYDIISVYY